jgi:hypothetical protein
MISADNAKATPAFKTLVLQETDIQSTLNIFVILLVVLP